MEYFNMNSESFDFESSEEKMIRQNKKKAKVTIIITVIVLLLAIGSFFTYLIIEHNKTVMKPIEIQGEMDIYDLSVANQKLVESQSKVIEKKEYLFCYAERTVKNNYINNYTLEVYTDGTFYEHQEEYLNGNNGIYSYMGNVDITKLENYILENREVLLTKDSVDVTDDHSAYDVGQSVVNVSGNYYALYEGIDDDYILNLLTIYNDEEKELVQNVELESE